MNIVLLEDCLSGACGCATAKDCKFRRCPNCDGLIDKDGKWIDDNDWHGEEPPHCADCGAPI
jgi:hypothetical protein